MFCGLVSLVWIVVPFSAFCHILGYFSLAWLFHLLLISMDVGIIYLIQRETHDRLLASLFKILMPLISCTPYESFFLYNLITIRSSVFHNWKNLECSDHLTSVFVCFLFSYLQWFYGLPFLSYEKTFVFVLKLFSFPIFWWLFCRYSRMPGELMPNLIISLRARIEEGFPLKTDQTGLLVSFASFNSILGGSLEDVMK